VLVVVLVLALEIESGPKASRTSKKPIMWLYETPVWRSFYFRSDRPYFWSEAALVWNYNSNAGVDSTLDYVVIVGWVEPTPGIVGFRYTQPNLHFCRAITKCETQQRPISEPTPKSFLSDQTGCPLAGGRRLYETAY